jgi:hypothetical protein
MHEKIPAVITVGIFVSEHKFYIKENNVNLFTCQANGCGSSHKQHDQQRVH